MTSRCSVPGLGWGWCSRLSSGPGQTLMTRSKLMAVPLTVTLRVMVMVCVWQLQVVVDVNLGT